MGLILSGWAGDNAGAVLGRQNNTLLVSITTTDRTPFPTQFLTTSQLEFGVSRFFDVFVCCLASQIGPFRFPAHGAWAIACTPLPLVVAAPSPSPPITQVYMIELAQVIDTSQGIQSPWQHGVNLFSFALIDPLQNGAVSSTIATATIDSNVRVITIPQG